MMEMMENLITIAIHSIEKAKILKDTLVNNNIVVILENVGSDKDELPLAIKVKVQIDDLPKALHIIESQNLFSYNNKETIINDDNRKRILVPVDFSEYSMQACALAFNLAADIGAKVKIIHIYFNPFYPNTFARKQPVDGKYESIEEKVKDNIQKLCSEIDLKIQTGEYPSVNYSYLVKEGLPEEEIVLFADDYKPDLIVIGTRGKDEKEGDLIGSVTADVIEMTHFPILAIPHQTPFTNLGEVKKISFLSNFSQRDLLSFDKMVSILRPYNILFEIIHVSTSRDEEWDANRKTEIRSYFSSKYDSQKVSFRQIEVKDFLRGIDEYIDNEHIDILALTTSKRNIFMRMFKPSISRGMLYHSNVPLFVLRG